jgi:hypothetical protein
MIGQRCRFQAGWRQPLIRRAADGCSGAEAEFDETAVISPESMVSRLSSRIHVTLEC